MSAQRHKGQGRGPARKTFISPESMQGPASPAADCQAEAQVEPGDTSVKVARSHSGSLATRDLADLVCDLVQASRPSLERGSQVHKVFSARRFLLRN
jgi:hypothetical protein